MLDLQLLKSNLPGVSTCALSMGYGNAHLVVMLESQSKIQEAINLLRTAPPVTSVWMDNFGAFGKYPASLSVTENQISFLVDGEECVDGSGQSFALYVPRSQMDELIAALQNAIGD